MEREVLREELPPRSNDSILWLSPQINYTVQGRQWYAFVFHYNQMKACLPCGSQIERDSVNLQIPNIHISKQYRKFCWKWFFHSKTWHYRGNQLNVESVAKPFNLNLTGDPGLLNLSWPRLPTKSSLIFSRRHGKNVSFLFPTILSPQKSTNWRLKLFKEDKKLLCALASISSQSRI